MAKKTAKKTTKKAAKKKPTTRRKKVFRKKVLTESTSMKTQIENLETALKKKAEWCDDLNRQHQIEKEDWDRERRRLQEIETTLTKKFNDEKALAFKAMELEFRGKMMEEVNKVKAEADAKLQKGIEENFTKLKDSLAKLHEEGNAQTKFTEQIALKMMSVIKPSVPVIEQKDVDTASV